MKRKIYNLLLGLLSGVANGLFGAGGGSVALPLMTRTGIEQKKSHATCIALVLPLCIISSIQYLAKTDLSLNAAVKYIPAGILGCLLGSFLLKKISNRLLKKIFGVFLIIVGLRMIMN